MIIRGAVPVTWTQIILLARELDATAEHDDGQGDPSEITSAEALRLASRVLQFESRLTTRPIRERA